MCAPYGTWRSPIDTETLFNRPAAPRYPVLYEDCLYWLEARAREGGRIVLMRRNPSGAEECLTPDGFSIRSRMHEYGGRCFVIGQDRVFFCNDSDQRIYTQELSVAAAPVPLTPAQLQDGSSARYADLKLAPNGQWLVFAMERQAPTLPQPTSMIAAIPAAPIKQQILTEPLTLVEGSDFYADPVVSSDEQQLAWLQWQHPYMPWDQSEVCTARLQVSPGSVALDSVTVIAGGSGCAVCQLGYGGDGRLLFALDEDANSDSAKNFWNLYAYDGTSVSAITDELLEYGAPHWVFGAHRYDRFGKEHLVCVRSDDRGDELAVVDLGTGRSDPLR